MKTIKILLLSLISFVSFCQERNEITFVKVSTPQVYGYYDYFKNGDKKFYLNKIDRVVYVGYYYRKEGYYIWNQLYLKNAPNFNFHLYKNESNSSNPHKPAKFIRVYELQEYQYENYDSSKDIYEFFDYIENVKLKVGEMDNKTKYIKWDTRFITVHGS